jgi:hypothetical protein
MDVKVTWVKVVKVGMALVLLSCLLDMSYFYFQFVRVIAVFAFAMLAHEAHKNNFSRECIIYILLAILFQPLIKVALGRTLWNLVDVLVALWLILNRSDELPTKT